MQTTTTNNQIAAYNETLYAIIHEYYFGFNNQAETAENLVQTIIGDYPYDYGFPNDEEDWCNMFAEIISQHCGYIPDPNNEEDYMEHIIGCYKEADDLWESLPSALRKAITM